MRCATIAKMVKHTAGCIKLLLPPRADPASPQGLLSILIDFAQLC